MNALTLSATRRRDKVVILSGLSLIEPKCSTPVTGRFFRMLFAHRFSTMVAAAAIAAMWWHALTAPSAVEAQRLIAITCLMASPWALVWMFRAIRHLQKGGAA